MNVPAIGSPRPISCINVATSQFWIGVVAFTNLDACWSNPFGWLNTKKTYLVKFIASRPPSPWETGYGSAHRWLPPVGVGCLQSEIAALVLLSKGLMPKPWIGKFRAKKSPPKKCRTCAWLVSVGVGASGSTAATTKGPLPALPSGSFGSTRLNMGGPTVSGVWSVSPRSLLSKCRWLTFARQLNACVNKDRKGWHLWEDDLKKEGWFKVNPQISWYLNCTWNQNCGMWSSSKRILTLALLNACSTAAILRSWA